METINVIKNILLNMEPESDFADYMLFICIICFVFLIIGLLFYLIEFLLKKFNLYDKVCDKLLKIFESSRED